MKPTLDLEEIKKAGVYTIDGDIKHLEQEYPLYYVVFYIDVRSWSERLKHIISKRIEQAPVWLMIDDSRIINRALVTNISEFEQLSTQINHLVHQLDEKYLNERILVTRKDGSVREVEIMLDKSTGKYAFVNLTTHHVCPCRFDTITDPVDDMRNDDFVVDFKLKDE